MEFKRNPEILKEQINEIEIEVEESFKKIDMEKEYEEMLENMYSRTLNDKLIMKSRLLDVKHKIAFINKQIRRCKTINSSAEFMNMASNSKVAMAKNMTKMRYKQNLEMIQEGVEMLEDEKEEINKMKLMLAENMIEKEKLAVDIREAKLKIFELDEERKYIDRSFRTRNRFKKEQVSLENIHSIITHLELKNSGQSVRLDSLSQVDLVNGDQEKNLEELVENAIRLYTSSYVEQRNKRIDQDEITNEIMRKRGVLKRLQRKANSLMIIEEEEEDADQSNDQEDNSFPDFGKSSRKQGDSVTAAEILPEQRTKTLLETDSRVNSDMLLQTDHDDYEFFVNNSNQIIKEYKREKELVAKIFNFEQLLCRFLKLSRRLVDIVLESYKTRSNYLVDEVKDKTEKFENDLASLKRETEFGNFLSEDTSLRIERSNGTHYSQVKEDIFKRGLEKSNSTYDFKALKSNYSEYFTDPELKRLAFYLSNDKIVNCYCYPGQLYAQLDLVKYDKDLYGVVEEFIMRVKTMGYNTAKDKIHRLFIMLSDLFYVYKRNLVIYANHNEAKKEILYDDKSDISTAKPGSKKNRTRKMIKPISTRDMIPELKQAMASRFNTRKRLAKFQKQDTLELSKDRANIWMGDDTPIDIEDAEDQDVKYNTTYGGFYKEANFEANSENTLLLGDEDKEKKEMIAAANDLKDVESAMRFQKKTTKNFHTAISFKKQVRKKPSSSMAPRKYQSRRIRSQQQQIRSRTSKIVHRNSNRKKKRQNNSNHHVAKKGSHYRITRKSSAATRPNTTALKRQAARVGKPSPYAKFLIPLNKKQKKSVQKKLGNNKRN